jgi:hypothetical protein
MVISNPALVVLEDTRGGLLRRFKHLCRMGRQEHAPAQYAPDEALDVVTPLADVKAELLTVAEELEPALTVALPASGPPVPFDTQAREIVLTVEERRARAIALRGLSQSRAHKFDAAHASFVQATQMDPALDLAKLPDFWRLPSGAHQAAIAAYEFVGRRRDAAALTAMVRSTFKPRLLIPTAARQPALSET